MPNIKMTWNSRLFDLGVEDKHDRAEQSENKRETGTLHGEEEKKHHEKMKVSQEASE